MNVCIGLRDVADGHLPSRVGHQLHESERARRGDRARVEGALLARDGVDHRRFHLRADRRIMRQAEGRERIMVERIAAPERRLADQAPWVIGRT